VSGRRVVFSSATSLRQNAAFTLGDAPLQIEHAHAGQLEFSMRGGNWSRPPSAAVPDSRLRCAPGADQNPAPWHALSATHQPEQSVADGRPAMCDRPAREEQPLADRRDGRVSANGRFLVWLGAMERGHEMDVIGTWRHTRRRLARHSKRWVDETQFPPRKGKTSIAERHARARSGGAATQLRERAFCTQTGCGAENELVGPDNRPFRMAGIRPRSHERAELVRRLHGAVR